MFYCVCLEAILHCSRAIVMSLSCHCLLQIVITCFDVLHWFVEIIKSACKTLLYTMLMFKCSKPRSTYKAFQLALFCASCAKLVVFFINNISEQIWQQSKNSAKVNIANICKRGLQSLSSFREWRDHYQALPRHLCVDNKIC